MVGNSDSHKNKWRGFFLYTTLKDQLLYEKKLQNSNLELFRLSQQPIPGSEIKTYGLD